MINKIIIPKQSFAKEILLFDKINKLTNMNILFGGNGIGKSILLKTIR